MCAKLYDLTKSSYTNYLTCPRLAWLYQHKKEKAVEDPKKRRRMDEGAEIGELAKRLFGKYTDVTERYPSGALNIPFMVERTRIAMRDGDENICEAAFIYDRCYCAVDILHRNGDCKNGIEYDMYEVKSTATRRTPSEDAAGGERLGEIEPPSKATYERHLTDAAYQKFITEKSGVRVGRVFLVYVNSEYALKGDFDINDFFLVKDVTNDLSEYSGSVEENIGHAVATIMGVEEPDRKFCKSCRISGSNCDFWEYCTKGDENNAPIPSPNVFDVYRISSENAANCMNEGIMSYEDLDNSDIALNPIQHRQIEIALHGGVHIDKDGIKNFLDGLWYPMYFLDFETFQMSVPRYENQAYNQQMPFQYSVHYIDKEGGNIEHREFLAESGIDPRRSIAESLVENIPTDACVLAYYKVFECGRIRELAETFPDIADKLLAIENNIRDLLDVFQGGYYYNAAMGGSFSIKSVLPAVFPDDPQFDYHSLEEIHNGLEASEAYFRMMDMSESEKAVTRKNLLKYCELDTYAMVILWQKLVSVCSGEDATSYADTDADTDSDADVDTGAGMGSGTDAGTDADTGSDKNVVSEGDR